MIPLGQSPEDALGQMSQATADGRIRFGHEPAIWVSQIRKGSLYGKSAVQEGRELKECLSVQDAGSCVNERISVPSE